MKRAPSGALFFALFFFRRVTELRRFMFSAVDGRSANRLVATATIELGSIQVAGLCPSQNPAGHAKLLRP